MSEKKIKIEFSNLTEMEADIYMAAPKMFDFIYNMTCDINTRKECNKYQESQHSDNIWNIVIAKNNLEWIIKKVNDDFYDAVS